MKCLRVLLVAVGFALYGLGVVWFNHISSHTLVLPTKHLAAPTAASTTAPPHMAHVDTHFYRVYQR